MRKRNGLIMTYSIWYLSVACGIIKVSCVENDVYMN